MEIGIVTSVVKGSAKLIVLPNQHEQIQVRSRSVAVIHVVDPKLSGLHLTEMILKVRIINVQDAIDVSICEVELRCQTFSCCIISKIFFLREVPVMLKYQ